MHNKIVDVVACELLVVDFEVILSYDSTGSNLQVPYVDSAARVTHKQTTLLVQDEDVWVELIKDCSGLNSVNVEGHLLGQAVSSLLPSTKRGCHFDSLFRSHDQLERFVIELVNFVDAGLGSNCCERLFHDVEVEAEHLHHTVFQDYFLR